jgi:hypothetical protein
LASNKQRMAQGEIMNKLTRDDFDKLFLIANRTKMYGQGRMTLLMDLECVHASIGLRLDDMLASDDSNFWHDIYGISANINRRTGKLENCFLPRFAKSNTIQGSDNL